MNIIKNKLNNFSDLILGYFPQTVKNPVNIYLKTLNNIYILLDVFPGNTGGYFTSCECIFPFPVGARKNASYE